jgi:hypothetical protein
MKSSQFFLEKAKQYIADLDSIILEYKEFDLDARLSSFSNNTPYAIQETTISEIKLKLNLLFSEFDKGDFFLEEIKKVGSGVLNWGRKEEENLKSYKSILELFIDHINQFRN